MAVGPGGRTETRQDRNPTTNVFLNFVYSVEDYLKHMELSKSEKKSLNTITPTLDLQLQKMNAQYLFMCVITKCFLPHRTWK